MSILAAEKPSQLVRTEDRTLSTTIHDQLRQERNIPMSLLTLKRKSQRKRRSRDMETTRMRRNSGKALIGKQRPRGLHEMPRLGRKISGAAEELRNQLGRRF